MDVTTFAEAIFSAITTVEFWLALIIAWAVAAFLVTAPVWLLTQAVRHLRQRRKT